MAATARTGSATRDGSTIDAAEVARFEGIAKTWWDPKGPMAVLHKFNPVRLAFIRDLACARFGRDPKTIRSLKGLTLVDIGCGGGVLSEPLARLGAQVTGLDPAPTNVAVARAHAEASGLSVDYRQETIVALVAEGASSIRDFGNNWVYPMGTSAQLVVRVGLIDREADRESNIWRVRCRDGTIITMFNRIGHLRHGGHKSPP